MTFLRRISELDFTAILKSVKKEEDECLADMEKHVASAFHNLKRNFVSVDIGDFAQRQGYKEARENIAERLRENKCKVLTLIDSSSEKEHHILRIDLHE